MRFRDRDGISSVEFVRASPVKSNIRHRRYWGAVAQGVGSLAGGALSSSAQSGASDRAAKASAEASMAAAKMQRQTSRQAAKMQYQQYLQSREDLAPYRYGGGQAYNALLATFGLTPYGYQDPQFTTIDDVGGGETAEGGMAELGTGARVGAGLGTPYEIQGGIRRDSGKMTVYQDPTAPAPGAPNYDIFKQSPGYQFRLEEGLKARERSAASKGMQISGPQMKSLTRYAQGFASEEFGNWYNQMARLASVGQTSTGQLASLGAGAAATAGGALERGGTAMATGIRGAGDARASGYLAQGTQEANMWELAGEAVPDILSNIPSAWESSGW